ncbi:ABC transporter substrate-binding protein [Paenibacillus terrigena]|uniref:ABC transporter substrate-binding protein n=1 Tax=Paenibacillus terrigena TaxID=369333 RepID=UPI00037BBC75|nr:ABC transporter substrate-binding protein [Paenibacillus terrigena]
MQPFKKRIPSVIAGLLVLSLTIVGCGTSSEPEKNPKVAENQTTKESEKKTEEPVELTFYIANSPVKDMDRILEAANKIIKEKINATLKLVVTDWSAYPQKMNLMISSGESFDLAFSGSFGELNYFQNASKGAYLDITDLLDKYAPVSKSRVPESIWQGVKVNGKIYGSINYQVWGMAGAKGVQLRKDFVDKYHFDWKSAKTWNDLTPFLDAVKKGEPGIIPWEYSNQADNFADMPILYGMDSVGDNKIPGWIRVNDKDIKVFNQYETQEYKDYLKTFRNWYVNGYIKKDAATMKDYLPDRKAKRIAALYANPYPDLVDMPELGVQSFMSHAPAEDKVYSVSKRFTEPFIPANSPSTAVVVVGANSKHPEKAVELIELLNTDDALFHLIAFGEEGKDYKKIGDKQIEMIKDMYNFNWSEWEIGQSYGRMLWDQNANVETQEKMLKMIYEADKTATVSPVMGFVFNSETVKTQIANVDATLKEYLYTLDSGSVDPDKYYAEFLDKLKKAGADDIIAEKQKQIDEWRAANGK